MMLKKIKLPMKIRSDLLIHKSLSVTISASSSKITKKEHRNPELEAFATERKSNVFWFLEENY